MQEPGRRDPAWYGVSRRCRQHVPEARRRPVFLRGGKLGQILSRPVRLPAYGQSLLDVDQTINRNNLMILSGNVQFGDFDTGAFVASAANESRPLVPLCRQLVEWKIDAFRERLLRGAVKHTAGLRDDRTRTLRVEAELDDPPPELRPGKFDLLTIQLTPPAGRRAGSNQP